MLTASFLCPRDTSDVCPPLINLYGLKFILVPMRSLTFPPPSILEIFHPVVHWITSELGDRRVIPEED
jgi:hypothetical protein